MADCTSAAMTIGGTITTEHFRELAEAIVDSGLGPDYERAYSVEDAEAAIRVAVRTGEPLCLMAKEVPCGKFESAESKCRDLGLTYVRADDGHYTWTPSVVYWTPGLLDPREWVGSVDDHRPSLSADEIRAHQERGTLEAELALMERAYNFSVALKPEIDLKTKIIIDHQTASGEPEPAERLEITWGEFVEANADGLGNVELEMVRDAVRGGEAYRGGGGAQPIWILSKDPDATGAAPVAGSTPRRTVVGTCRPRP